MANDQRKVKRGVRLRSRKNSSTSHDARPTGTIEDFIGVLAGKRKKVATLEEIKQATEDGWAGKISMRKRKS